MARLWAIAHMLWWQMSQGFKWLVQGFKWLAQGFKWLARGFEWLAQGFKWLARGFKWLAQGFKWLAQGFKWLARGFEWLARGFKWLAEGFAWLARDYREGTFPLKQLQSSRSDMATQRPQDPTLPSPKLRDRRFTAFLEQRGWRHVRSITPQHQTNVESHQPKTQYHGQHGMMKAAGPAICAKTTPRASSDGGVAELQRHSSTHAVADGVHERTTYTAKTEETPHTRTENMGLMPVCT